MAPVGGMDKFVSTNLAIAPRWTGRIYNEPVIAWLPSVESAPRLYLAAMPQIDEEKDKHDSYLEATDSAFSDLNEPLIPIWKA
jgi:hypothetical protein